MKSLYFSVEAGTSPPKFQLTNCLKIFSLALSVVRQFSNIVHRQLFSLVTQHKVLLCGSSRILYQFCSAETSLTWPQKCTVDFSGQLLKYVIQHCLYNLFCCSDAKCPRQRLKNSLTWQYICSSFN